MSSGWLATAHEVLRIELEALAAVERSLDETQFERAVQLILDRPDKRVIATGIGKSGHIAHKIAATMSSTGTPTIFVSAAEGVHGDLGMIQPGEVVLAFSYSGESDEIAALLPALVRLRTPVIAVTGRPDSTLGRHSEVILDVAVEREACPHNLSPTASTTVMLAIGDALAMTTMKARHFTTEDFARVHPGGSLGRRLLLTVGDVMRSGSDHAVVATEATVTEALLVMTRSPIRGVVNVVDGDRKLVGIFTDGDLRRHLQVDGADLLTKPIGAVMTANPTTIGANRLATEALAIMQPREFDNLSVVDEHGRALGIVDVQDLLKAGLT